MENSPSPPLPPLTHTHIEICSLDDCPGIIASDNYAEKEKQGRNKLSMEYGNRIDYAFATDRD